MIEIPGYQVQKEIDSGAMATVYLAVQTALERKVALKIMAPNLAADPAFCARFLKEGKTVARLVHPHIVTIHDIGNHDSCYYMAMEYLGAGNLKQRIGGLGPDQTLEILCQVASALGYAHRHDVVHRDVKPANILFREDGTAVLSDFGIAKALGDATQITATRGTIGTPSYMSPEQAQGQAVTGQSDLYSLGIALYEMLTGEKPYRAEDYHAVMWMHIHGELPRLPEPFTAYQGLLDRLLAKDPAERFAKAEDLIQAVRAAATPTAGTVVLPPERSSASRRIPRPIVLAGLPALALVVLSGAGLYAFWPNSTEPPPIVRPAAPPLDPDIQAQVDRLLMVARSHLSGGRLVEPPVSNAREVYRRVLELDPHNAEATEGLQTIADALPREDLVQSQENP